MNTQNHNRKNREDVPENINAEESDFEHATKKIKAQEKISIKEHDQGRKKSQNPYEEHLEKDISQMDKETIKLQQEKKQNLEDGLKSEINDDDDRDHNDSTQDWDAENSRTGRHK